MAINQCRGDKRKSNNQKILISDVWKKNKKHWNIYNTTSLTDSDHATRSWKRFIVETIRFRLQISGLWSGLIEKSLFEAYFQVQGFHTESWRAEVMRVPQIY